MIQQEDPAGEMEKSVRCLFTSSGADGCQIAAAATY